VALLALGVGGWLVWRAAFEPTAQQLARASRSAWAREDWEQAGRLAERALRKSPEEVEARVILARWRVRSGHPDEAVTLLLETPTAAAGAGHAFAVGGQQALDQGDAARAEECFRKALATDADDVESANQLAYLLGVEGRTWEARPWMIEVLKRQQATPHHLILLGGSQPIIRDPALEERCLAHSPDALAIRLGEARTALFEGKSREVLPLLQRIVKAAPNLAEAQARLGWAVLEVEPEHFEAWLAAAPAECFQQHPEPWAVRGAWERSQDRLLQAAQCFAEAVRRDPDHQLANYQLGEMLTRLERSSEAASFLERASKLQQLALLVDHLYERPNDLGQLRRAADLAGALGRPYETWGWCQLALQHEPGLEWARKSALKFEPWLTSGAPATLPDALPKIPDDLRSAGSDADAIGRRQIAALKRKPNAAEDSRFDVPRFEDVAHRTGIDFTYQAGSQRTAEGVWLVEFVGGGVAAFDFDADGRCDLFFTQGRPLPLEPGENLPSDRLYRHLPDHAAVDVTQSAGLIDADYSHGCAAGDYDQDGFPDLYVCNLGPNRLYRNNGDGTFTETTSFSGLHGQAWTTSAAIVDLNGDGLPEIFDVNYLRVDLQNIPFCPRGTEDAGCGPAAHLPARDVLWLNQGDGRFSDASDSAGVIAEQTAGRGLGIVAGDLNGDGKLDVYVANDADPNFLYVRRDVDSADMPGRVPRFEEVGIPAGVAYDRDGMAQASMGIAAGDVDRDGRLDLFVTNYADQSNTLYLQTHDGFFEDATREMNLREPSFALLGFGTQFLDADLDGWLDLVLTNGHVYDFRYAGRPYAMRPQLMHNTRRGKFREIFSEQGGEFFAQERVGRPLAKLDWDQDGREDFVVSHIGKPAALVVNHTERPGHFVSLRLIGTASERDATGARVTLALSDGTRLTQQLTAGDGYQCTNERRLICGLGEAHVERLEIRWPSGVHQVLTDVARDEFRTIVEPR
jgi:tetratricopeptide (TPR) repeat protein